MNVQLVRAQTEIVPAPLCPELRLHLATERTPLWRMTEAQAAAIGLREPYWAFCWPGGQALARHVLDQPQLVRGKRVLDFGSGCAVEGLAALRAGAASVLAADIDPMASVAARLNAELNGLAIETTEEDLVGSLPPFDVVLAGDVFYDCELAARGLAWLRRLARAGVLVLAGDPQRGFLDLGGLERIASMPALHDGDLTGTIVKDTGIYRVS
jgi:predicted nicotinamide N-methyase